MKNVPKTAPQKKTSTGLTLREVLGLSHEQVANIETACTAELIFAIQ